MIPPAQIVSDRVTADRAGPLANGPLQSRLNVSPGSITPAATLNLPHGIKLGTTVSAQLQPGLFLLNISGQQIAAHSNLLLTVGMKLFATVDQSGPGLVLKIVNGSLPPASNPQVNSLPAGAQQQVVDQALRWALPRQQPIAELLTQLNKLSADEPGGGLKEPLLRILTQPNDPRQLLQPQRLIQALTNSGVLLEHKLLTTPNQSPEADIKANLLRALQVASTGTGIDNDGNRVQKQLREIANSALARIETQQLSTVRDESGRRVLTTDLILREAERTTAVEIAIDRPPPQDPHSIDADEQASLSPAAHRWQVTLNFDLPGIGKLQSLIRLDSTLVQVDFRSDQADTRDQLTTRFKELEERLKTAGMPNSQLTAGVLKHDSGNHSARIDPAGAPAGNLIDLNS